jgi:hypothetical protein
MSLLGSYYISDSAPHIVKTHFSSQTLGGLGEANKNMTILIFKGQYVKTRAVQSKKQNTTFKNVEISQKRL